MTHYLRTLDGTTIVDVEATKDDISCVVSIAAFSELLLGKFTDAFCGDGGAAVATAVRQQALADTAVLIADFDLIQEIRGEYHETQHGFDTPDDLAEQRLKVLAEKWQLYYVTD